MLRYLLILTLLVGCTEKTDGPIIAKEFENNGTVTLTTEKGGRYNVEASAVLVAIGEDAKFTGNYLYIGKNFYYINKSARRDH